MKRPWHFWLLCTLCTAVVVGAMLWLTANALELDRSEAAARRQAELEQAVSRALWRIDVTVIPLLAREAARPYSAYQPVVDLPQSGAASYAMGPLQSGTPEFVWLNFQCNSADEWSSPQVPAPETETWVIQNGAKPAVIEGATSRLEELRQKTNFDHLAGLLPTEMLEPNRPVQQLGAASGKVNTVIKGAGENQGFGRGLTKGSLSASKEIMESLPLSRVQSQYQAPRLVQEELENRDAAVQAYAQNVVIAQRNSSGSWSNSVREGVSQPVWVGDELLLARRVELKDGTLIQGCWLDWPEIRSLLLDQIGDLLPQASLVPVQEGEWVPVGRMLATLPVRLVTPPTPHLDGGWSAMQMALVTAWACLAIAIIAIAALSQGVLALSERRGAFVSSVTHELRTPLTTFRMYSEMLAQDMVPTAEKRRQYLETLRIEADRLSHLVENVLSYARIERGHKRCPPESVTVNDLIGRVERRLRERAEQAEMELVVSLPDDSHSALVRTDPAAVEQILFNLVDNACKYAASADDRRIHLDVYPQDQRIRFVVRDHGQGISSRERRQLFRPFSKSAADAAQSAPGVGLGLALCRRIARELRGRLWHDDTLKDGARFILELRL